MAGRSTRERSFLAQAERIAYVVPEGGTARVEDRRTVSLVWFMNRAAANNALNIPPEVGAGAEQRFAKVSAHSRTTQLLGQSGGGSATSTAVSEYNRSIGAKGRQGSKTIILTTGKKTEKGNYQTIACRFPRWVRNADIGDLLAPVLGARIKYDGTLSNQADHIAPTYRVVGGKTYSFPPIARAEATPVPRTATSEADAQTIITSTAEGTGTTT